MQYVPTNDKEFLATLLCNRALAHYNIGNYQEGLSDAKGSTTFRPEWYKVSYTLIFRWKEHGLIHVQDIRLNHSDPNSSLTTFGSSFLVQGLREPWHSTAS